MKDNDARLTAIASHHRSILVEAGAGSGKTAVMAGRIAMLLADGIAPANIAAVTFTELAASELLSRVREFVTDLLAGHVVPELRVALPDGLSDTQRPHLARSAAAIDEITCSTIHGFCQRLIKPYPAEADIDPGATIIDRTQGDLAFLEIVDTWLREHLSGGPGGLMAAMVLHDPRASVELIHRIAQALRRRRGLRAPPAPEVPPLFAQLQRAARTFIGFHQAAAAVEADTATMATCFHDLVTTLAHADPATPAGLIELLTACPSEQLVTKAGTFRVYKKKGKWLEAAKCAGLPKADAERLNTEATGHYDACGAAWAALQQGVASRALAVLIEDTKPILERYRAYKRGSAQLDFDDLIFSARNLLRDHESVRRALGQRFRYVLVDEFQDTDPLQTEIFWRLCGDPAAPDAPWSQFSIRPGALFLVGDPKQAIYRFRGADVAAYVGARDAFKKQDGQDLLSISTNFRSRAPILTFVNETFQSLLSAAGQPGFAPLDAFHDDRSGGLCVAALDIRVADEEGKASAEEQRDAEAEAVADLCCNLIGRWPVLNRRSGEARACQPGDIALLAPTGNDLWRYEEALERRGIPVATQAGKGLFRRQEIQDVIALTRVLADRRDTLALGALLRGPLVGLTEEELLDIVWALPRYEGAPDDIPRLDLRVDASLIRHPLAADVIVKLDCLYKRSNSTTPHELLSQAVDVFRIRPILLARHHGQAERALANLDLYLSLATAYAVRGLQAFAEAMTAAWSDEESAVEGRPDAQEESVALFTMHAAKGLEWPIIIPINTMTQVVAPDSAVVDRDTDTFYCPILGVAPAGHQDVLDAEKRELNRERVRLWYVATTRARELLILPRSDIGTRSSAWNALVDFRLPGLPAIDTGDLQAATPQVSAVAANTQTREIFAAEAAAIASRQTHLTWRAPSRHEGGIDTDAVATESPDVWSAGVDELTPDLGMAGTVQGGRQRGLILHKLMEEILNIETADDPPTVLARATDLIRALGETPVDDAAVGLCAAELAACVARTLALPQVAELRSALRPEFPVYGLLTAPDGQCATLGIADALSFSANGTPDVVVDWKSDVTASPGTLDQYRAQVAAYLDITGASRGLIVLMTTGAVLEVTPGSGRSTA